MQVGRDVACLNVADRDLAGKLRSHAASQTQADHPYRAADVRFVVLRLSYDAL